MDFYKENLKKLDAIIENTKKDNRRATMESVNEYVQQLSLNIGLAINPITEATLPFVVYILEYYARELKKGKENEINAVLKSIEKSFGAVSVKMPGGIGGAGGK